MQYWSKKQNKQTNKQTREGISGVVTLTNQKWRNRELTWELSNGWERCIGLIGRCYGRHRLELGKCRTRRVTRGSWFRGRGGVIVVIVAAATVVVCTGRWKGSIHCMQRCRQNTQTHTNTHTDRHGYY